MGDTARHTVGNKLGNIRKTECETKRQKRFQGSRWKRQCDADTDKLADKVGDTGDKGDKVPRFPEPCHTWQKRRNTTPPPDVISSVYDVSCSDRGAKTICMGLSKH